MEPAYGQLAVPVPRCLEGLVSARWSGLPSTSSAGESRRSRRRSSRGFSHTTGGAIRSDRNTDANRRPAQIESGRRTAWWDAAPSALKPLRSYVQELACCVCTYPRVLRRDVRLAEDGCPGTRSGKRMLMNNGLPVSGWSTERMRSSGGCCITGSRFFGSRLGLRFGSSSGTTSGSSASCRSTDLDNPSRRLGGRDAR